jgi:hypothetical protein
MSEEKPENVDAKPNKLKTVDVRTLEATIARAVSELLGAEYNCEVNNISYSSSTRD